MHACSFFPKLFLCALGMFVIHYSFMSAATSLAPGEPAGLAVVVLLLLPWE
jgi:hypothetical protein